jgi:DNA repair exonuclease SbcCD ATPase subunit
MITRVLLRNWRGYQKLSLDFGPGLTFVIADNGVGKTSLVNGVAWALFGAESGVDAEAAIRVGANEASAEVDLVIGDRTYTVTRTLGRAGPGQRPRHQVTHDLPDGWAEAADVPAAILPQLMFVPEMRLTHEGELFADVQGHLGALLGIDDLRRAAVTLRQTAADAGREVQAARAVARADAATVAALARQLDEVRQELGRLDEAIEADADERARLDTAARALRDWAAYDRLLARHQARVEELAGELRSVGIDPSPTAADAAAAQAGDEARELHADLVAADTETGLVEGLVEQLQGADAVCPVCLQSLDEPTAAHAAAQHDARLAELAERRAETERRRRAVDAAATKLRSIAEDLARQQPPEPPEGARPDLSEDEVRTQLASLEAARDERVARRGALGAELDRAEAAFEEAVRSQRVDAELTSANAVAAAAGSLARLADAEADTRAERALAPIGNAIAARWAEFFVTTQARPRLAAGASIELGHGDVAIPYTSFSGGEKTLASLLTRLLFTTTATGLRSMWLDEPLEHLDPVNRTRVARLLAQVTQPGSRMRQMVVTTYEEGLARSMVGRHAADVVYVSTDPVL